MDATKLLCNKGWRGLGYSLDKKDRGIKHPLMIKYKDNTLGLGKDAQKLPSDQWWLHAFDQSLSAMGTGQSTVLSEMAARGSSKGVGLYTYFVRGGFLEGTMIVTPQSADSSKEQPKSKSKPISKSKKRDREPDEPRSSERSAAKRAKSDKSLREDNEAKKEKKRRKEERRARRAQKTEMTERGRPRSRGAIIQESYLPTPASSPLPAAPEEAEGSSCILSQQIKPHRLEEYKAKAAKKGVSLEQYAQMRRKRRERKDQQPNKDKEKEKKKKSARAV